VGGNIENSMSTTVGAKNNFSSENQAALVAKNRTGKRRALALTALQNPIEDSITKASSN